MAYTYPDRQDRLTCQLIETEYDGAYWGESEDAVLEQAKAAIATCREGQKGGWAEEEISMLDAGCGLGRLFSVFCGESVDRITAVEPDLERYTAAAEEGSRMNAQMGPEGPAMVKVIHGDCSAAPEDERYQVVLSSHVLQHITRGMAQELMGEMADRLRPKGLLIVTTTCTDGKEDQFFRESWKEGGRYEEPIDGATFDETFGTDGVLPVRIFAIDTVKTMAERCGLSCIKTSAYHFKGHHRVAEDRLANEAEQIGGARDMMYLFIKEENTGGGASAEGPEGQGICDGADGHDGTERPVHIDGNICYHFSFSIFDEKTGLRTDDEEELRAAIRKAYPDAVFHDDPEAEKEPIFRDLKIGQGFLHGGGLPFGCFRALLKGYRFQFQNFDMTDSAVLLTVFPESDTVQMCLCLSIKEAEIDDYVYLRHVQGNGARLVNADLRQMSVREVFEEVSSSLKRLVTDVEETYLIEIKRWEGYESVASVDTIVDQQTRAVYGIMTGDEGWRHVPEKLAEERMKNSWGSRDFIRFISFGANSIFFNLYQTRIAADYRENRRKFDDAHYGDMNPYFLLDSDIAGVNHGILFSMELVMVIKTICNRILRRQANYYLGGQGTKMHAEIRKIKAYRGELITTLNKVENLSISEIGELERVMLISQQIEPIIEKIKYLLELLESELDLLYQTSTNKLVNLLTVAGVILAAIQVLIAVL